MAAISLPRIFTPASFSCHGHLHLPKRGHAASAFPAMSLIPLPRLCIAESPRLLGFNHQPLGFAFQERPSHRSRISAGRRVAVNALCVQSSAEGFSAIVGAVSRSFVAAALFAKAMFRTLKEDLFSAIAPLRQEEVKTLASLKGGLQYAVLPLCFAAISQSPPVSTPLTVVAAGMAKWLELYSGVLMIRVLLTWFPNIPWDRQPLQAIRDMCDPYLNLFRNLVPPIFNALDVSPMLAFFVLGLLASILNTSVQG
ncbi:hypothetical protein O6H91_17G040000 [Diphasiastrum complanatum]|uniref:Uncharacterized protein n=1 Tax=Diphasiastrum complanatum TaxID=34168 RepID=A0ACC2B634_DIPCM|nr:hypothetical protein O6H91_17G040000 [Diphasiastrum complanatum]